VTGTKPKPESHWTLLGWIGMPTVSQAPSPNINASLMLFCLNGNKSLRACSNI